MTVAIYITLFFSEDNEGFDVGGPRLAKMFFRLFFSFFLSDVSQFAHRCAHEVRKITWHQSNIIFSYHRDTVVVTS